MTRRSPRRRGGDELAGGSRGRSEPAFSADVPDTAGAARALDDFLGFCDIAADLVSGGRDSYDADQWRRLSAATLIQWLGEAVARAERCDPDRLDAQPEVPWRSIKATRNRVAHQCGAIDYDLLWNALADHVPRHAEAVRAIVGRSP